jgi:mannosylglycoprotein endo-beta-mannosidase
MGLIKENLALLEQEEDYWLSRCHEQCLLKGDNNTSYFHKIANGRRRKMTIVSLEKDGVVIEGDDSLLQHATDYYTNLFGPEDDHDIHIDPDLWSELSQVSIDENVELCKPFSENEIKNALFQMETNKAAGPHKIPIEFYQTCWDVVKTDIIQLFDDFHAKKVNISRINVVLSLYYQKILMLL